MCHGICSNLLTPVDTKYLHINSCIERSQACHLLYTSRHSTTLQKTPSFILARCHHSIGRSSIIITHINVKTNEDKRSHQLNHLQNDLVKPSRRQVHIQPFARRLRNLFQSASVPSAITFPNSHIYHGVIHLVPSSNTQV